MSDKFTSVEEEGWPEKPMPSFDGCDLARKWNPVTMICKDIEIG
jgi:hypothetical protein